MELIHQLLGTYAIEVWIAGMFWSLLGILAVKLYYVPSNVKFNLKFWLNDNLVDVLKGLFWALVILRLGDYVLHLAEDKLNWTIPETTDFVIVMIVISGFIQYKLHQNRKPISKKVQQQMHVHNENCKH
jgi:hypothetical protein|tara:strand:+ start:39162 stop:39548 length:387 start_codon:yes stop_codon:yes gene_type:complete